MRTLRLVVSRIYRGIALMITDKDPKISQDLRFMTAWDLGIAAGRSIERAYPTAPLSPEFVLGLEQQHTAPALASAGAGS